MAWKALTDAEWDLISPFIPVQKRGIPRSRNREILDAILFILSTNCRWEELPPDSLQFSQYPINHNPRQPLIHFVTISSYLMPKRTKPTSHRFKPTSSRLEK
jgi:transposase